MTNIIWKIEQLERSPVDGFVTTVYYRVEATDGGYQTSTYGAVNYEQIADDGIFTPYEDLTEADVISWVQSTLSQSDIEAALTAEIEAMKTPTTLTGMPWSEQEIQE